MGDQEKFQPRHEWPDYVTQTLERVGIGQYETVETIRPKIESLGLQIIAMDEDRGGMLSTYSLYYAAVIDPNDQASIRGEYWSNTDYAEALAWAAAHVLRDREERQQRNADRLASTEPDDYVFQEFGATVQATRSHLGTLPDDAPKDDFVAHLLVGEEVVARVEMPFVRGGKEWTNEDEQSLQLALAQWAWQCDLRQRVGPVQLVLAPGTPQQTDYPVARKGVVS